MKAAAKNRKQTAYTRGPYSKVRTSDIVVTDSNGQASYFTDPVDGKLARRGQYTYRSNSKDNSFASGAQNFLNTTAAGLMDLYSYVPYAAGKALDAVGSPVGKDLIQTSKDLELDARRVNRYEVAPADFLSASTLGSLLPSLGLAAVTGGNSLYLDANTSRAFTKHITKDLGGSPLLSNILGSVAGAATALPIGRATLQGATKQALTKYLQSAATRAALNTGIGVGTAAAPQLFTGDYEGALNTATTIAPIIAGSSIVASGLPKAAAYKGYDALTRKYQKNLYARDKVWADSRKNLPWFISKKHADRARQLFLELDKVIKHSSYGTPDKKRDKYQIKDLVPYDPKSFTADTYNKFIDGDFEEASLLIPELANLFEGQVARSIDRVIDPTYLIPKSIDLQDAVQQSQRLTGKSMNVKNVPQAQQVYEGTGIMDAYLRKVLQSIYDPDNPTQGTIGHYLRQSQPGAYDAMIRNMTNRGIKINDESLTASVKIPILKDGELYSGALYNHGDSFKHSYIENSTDLRDYNLSTALQTERNLGVLFSRPHWNLKYPAEGSFTPFTKKGVLDLVSKKAANLDEYLEALSKEAEAVAHAEPLIMEFAKEFEAKFPGEAPLKIEKIKDVKTNKEIKTPDEAKELFNRGLPRDILDKLGLDIKGVDSSKIPLHTRALSGRAAVNDMIKSGVVRSVYGAAGESEGKVRTGTIFRQKEGARHGEKVGQLEAIPIDANAGRTTGRTNTTLVSQFTSPDFDFRTGGLSHYVDFSGGRDNEMPGGNIVAVVNPNAMGGDYYQIGKPHGYSFTDEQIPSKKLLEMEDGQTISSENTFEHITRGVEDYRDISRHWDRVEGAIFNNPNIGTIHRTFGRKLNKFEQKILEGLGIDKSLLSKQEGLSEPIVPIAPPIRALSLFEFHNTPEFAIDPYELYGATYKVEGIDYDMDYVKNHIRPIQGEGQLSSILDKLRSTQLERSGKIKKLESMMKVPPIGKEGLYLLPNSEMQRFVDAMEKADSNYGTSEVIIKGTPFRASNQI